VVNFGSLHPERSQVPGLTPEGHENPERVEASADTPSGSLAFGADNTRGGLLGLGLITARVGRRGESGFEGVVPLRCDGSLGVSRVRYASVHAEEGQVMGYPPRLLSEGEEIVSQFRPHWSGILREGALILGGVVSSVLVLILDYSPWIIFGAWVLIFVVVIKNLVHWFTSQHVITNERLIYRTGFIGKRGTEIPLEVIQNVAFNQTILERMLGTGDLLVESAGTHGQTRYRDIPKPERVQSLIYQQREQRQMEVKGGGGGGSREMESTASQLERLSRLHDDGKLTDDEFAAQKAKLLNEG
jgi:membrane protein YdbS with pleckstrin-like domain